MLDGQTRDEVQAMINEAARPLISAVNQSVQVMHEFVALTAMIQQEVSPFRADLLEFEHKMSQDLIDLRTEVRGVREEARGLRLEVELVTDRLERLDVRLTMVESDVAELKSDVAELKSDVAELKSGVEEILRRL
jgi:predicted nuclease with TOPRIM domain